MARIRGHIVTTPVKSDFNQTDPNKSDYIKNNPLPRLTGEDEGKILVVKKGKFSVAPESHRAVVNITSIDEIYETVADLPTDAENGTHLVVSSERAIYKWETDKGEWVLSETFRAHTLYCVLTGENSGIYRYTMAKPYLVPAEQAAVSKANEYTDEKIGDIDTALDSIIARQTSVIGGVE